jgi:hypothetical protein
MRPVADEGELVLELAAQDAVRKDRLDVEGDLAVRIELAGRLRGRWPTRARVVGLDQGDVEGVVTLHLLW